jgi:hypothetical protein
MLRSHRCGTHWANCISKFTCLMGCIAKRVCPCLSRKFALYIFPVSCSLATSACKITEWTKHENWQGIHHVIFKCCKQTLQTAHMMVEVRFPRVFWLWHRSKSWPKCRLARDEWNTSHDTNKNHVGNSKLPSRYGPP